MRRGLRTQLINSRRWHKWLSPYTADLDAARQRFVGEAVHGLLATGRPVLSVMARGIRSHGEHVDYTVKRFSRNLASPHWEPTVLHETFLRHNAAWVAQDTPIYIDLSELAKPHARKMAHLCRVRDASDPDKRTTHGYWLLEAYAEPTRGVLVPLLLVLFSTRQRKFLSQNDLVLRHLETLDATLGPRGIFIMDRGFDARGYFDALLALRRRFIIRLGDTRDLICEDGVARRVPRLALRLLRPADDRDVVRSTRVRLPRGEHDLLFVATPKRRSDPRPIKLLAWLGEEPFDLDHWTHECRRLYRRRWKAEDAIRFLKTDLALERVRVLSWRALQHMIGLAALAMTLIALMALEPTAWLTKLLACGRPRRAPAEFLFYRIRLAVAHLLKLDPLL
jgi:Transposase DDE domain